MHVLPSIVQGSEPTFFFPLVKADAKNQLIYARAAAEVPDKAREIMDYVSAKPQFETWSNRFKETTMGKSLGNVRAMHDPKHLAGKVSDLFFDDGQKTIDVVIKVLDPIDWHKAEQGGYTGISIGGGYLKKWKDEADPTLTRYTPRIGEISLVDAPCIPTATFLELQKVDGSTEQVMLKGTPRTFTTMLPPTPPTTFGQLIKAMMPPPGGIANTNAAATAAQTALGIPKKKQFRVPAPPTFAKLEKAMGGIARAVGNVAERGGKNVAGRMWNWAGTGHLTPRAPKTPGLAAIRDKAVERHLYAARTGREKLGPHPVATRGSFSTNTGAGSRGSEASFRNADYAAARRNFVNAGGRHARSAAAIGLGAAGVGAAAGGAAELNDRRQAQKSEPATFAELRKAMDLTGARPWYSNKPPGFQRPISRGQLGPAAHRSMASGLLTAQTGGTGLKSEPLADLAKRIPRATLRTPQARAKIEAILHEHKHGELRSWRGRNARGQPRKGPVVTDRKQAIAIALNQAARQAEKVEAIGAALDERLTKAFPRFDQAGRRLATVAKEIRRPTPSATAATARRTLKALGPQRTAASSMGKSAPELFMGELDRLDKARQVGSPSASTTSLNTTTGESQAIRFAARQPGVAASMRTDRKMPGAVTISPTRARRLGKGNIERLLGDLEELDKRGVTAEGLRNRPLVTARRQETAVQIAEREKNHTGLGTGIGAAGGFLVGHRLGGLAGGVAGATVGATIGSAIHTGHRVRQIMRARREAHATLTEKQHEQRVEAAKARWLKEGHHDLDELHDQVIGTAKRAILGRAHKVAAAIEQRQMAWHAVADTQAAYDQVRPHMSKRAMLMMEVKHHPGLLYNPEDVSAHHFNSYGKPNREVFLLHPDEANDWIAKHGKDAKAVTKLAPTGLVENVSVLLNGVPVMLPTFEEEVAAAA